jgi:glycerophosphoryl diester phosphodiesterase
MKHPRALKLALAATFVSLAIGAVPAAAELMTLNGQRPIVIAHRGASGYLPEHTMQGYQLAVQLGANFIEPDLFLTKDGVLVARHDRSLNATTNVVQVAASNPALAAKAVNGQFFVDQLTYSEIQSLTAKSRTASGYQTVNTYFDPSFDYNVASLGEVLDYSYNHYKETGEIIGVYPEVKIVSGDPAYNQAIAQAMLAMLMDPKYEGYFNGELDNIFLQSFDPAIVALLNGMTGLPTVQLGACPADLGTLSGVAGYADGIGVSRSGLSKECIEKAHELGLIVHAYTFTDNPAQYTDPYLWGVDGVFANHPDIAGDARDALFPVPEPATLALFGAALLTLVATRTRRSGPTHAAIA